MLPRPAIDIGQGLYGPLRSTFPTGTLSLGAGRGGFKGNKETADQSPLLRLCP
jgi:hypothetical protein